jgi:hypothetical protein
MNTLEPDHNLLKSEITHLCNYDVHYQKDPIPLCQSRFGVRIPNRQTFEIDRKLDVWQLIRFIKEEGVKLRRDLTHLTSSKLINFIFWQRFGVTVEGRRQLAVASSESFPTYCLVRT